MISSTESESALLGALLVNPREIDIVVDTVSVFDFADRDIGCLYDALVTLHQTGLPVGDMTVLVPELRRAGVPEAVRASAFLARLAMNGIAGHAAFYAGQVRRGSRLRQQADLAQELSELTARADADPDRIAQWLESASASVGVDRANDCRIVGEVAAEYIAELREPKARQRAVMSGVVGLDETVGGFMPGELVVLAARTAMGKTALALQIACHVAAHGRGVLFVSLEMADHELVGRILCGTSSVNSQLIRTGEYDDRDLGRLEWAAGKLQDHRLFIWDPFKATTSQIRARAKRCSMSGGLGLIVVDYVGLVQPPDPRRQKWEQISAITGDLKGIAKELGVPILALAQLNREADTTQPRLSHLRDSGSVEQDADCVLFIHREPKKTAATLNIAKHRHAATGTINLRWVAEQTRFEDGPSVYEALP